MLQTNSKSTLQLINEGQPALISDHSAELTVAKAQQSSQISLIKKEQGKDYLRMTIAGIINELLPFVPNQIGSAEIAAYSTEISNTYWHWKIDDLILCLRNGMNGLYGKEYHKFTYQTFSEWANKYEVEKENHFHNKHLDTKETSTTREDTKHMIYKERAISAPVNIKAPPSLGGIIADENYFNPKK